MRDRYRLQSEMYLFYKSCELGKRKTILLITDYQDIIALRDFGNRGFARRIYYDDVYLRLLITDWHGYAPQINVVIIYSPGKPPIPKIPQGDYVLIVGNQQDGFTFTELARFVKEIHLGLETVTVPHYEVSLEMVNSLAKKPVAIILSGNNADYQNLPMFEYNGEFELIRECDIPILGICCGHQMTVMAYGYTYAHSMGWEDITSLEDLKKIRPISIKKDNQIFAGLPNPFIAPEIHGWAVDVLPADYEVLAASTYIHSLKSNKKMLYHK